MQYPHDTYAFRRPAATTFAGIWIPLVTPFRDGAVDHPALRRLVRHYRRAGVHGFVACGSTGEAAALDERERLDVLETILAEAGTTPVAMGLGGASQRELLAAAAVLGRFPAAALLASAPAYVRPGQAGVRAWFTALADAARQPVIVYDIPYRTGAHIDADTLLALAEHPNIAAVKDCGGDLAKTAMLIEDGRLAVFAGEDLHIFNTLCMGGAGAIAASAHLEPELFIAMFDAVRAQRLERARGLFHALAPLIRAMFAESNPAPLKSALAERHGISAQLRPPMTAASAAAAARLREVLGSLSPAGAAAGSSQIAKNR